MAVSRIRCFVCATAVALVAVAVTPAFAESAAHQDVNCGWGQSGSALFRENAEHAGWEISATYDVKHGDDEERRESPGTLYHAARGLYRVTYTPSSANQRIVSIHVRSSGSVQAAGGQQCADVHPPTRNSTAFPESPLDDVMLPPIVAPEAVSTRIGGCRFAAVTDTLAGQGQMTGEIDVEAVVYSVTDPFDNPLSATFTCYIRVDGQSQPGSVVAASGTGVVIGGGVVTYTSNDVSDLVQLCQDVSYSNGVNTSDCFEANSFEIPPPIVWEIVDPLPCSVLALLAPGAPGVVDINSQGDVYVDGEPQYDCPPYDRGHDALRVHG